MIKSKKGKRNKVVKIEFVGFMAGFGQIAYEASELDNIRATLDRKLGPEFISTRSGPGGGKLHYLEGNKAIELANKVFGFNGWSSSIVDMTVDYVEDSGGKCSLGISCVVRVTLKDGAYREDIGYGSIDNARSKNQAFEKAKKEAVTDALKRALRGFGNALGNCIYDKTFLKDVQRLPSNQTTMDVNELLRSDSNTVAQNTTTTSSAVKEAFPQAAADLNKENIKVDAPKPSGVQAIQQTNHNPNKSPSSVQNVPPIPRPVLAAVQNRPVSYPSNNNTVRSTFSNGGAPENPSISNQSTSNHVSQNKSSVPVTTGPTVPYNRPNLNPVPQQPQQMSNYYNQPPTPSTSSNVNARPPMTNNNNPSPSNMNSRPPVSNNNNPSPPNMNARPPMMSNNNPPPSNVNARPPMPNNNNPSPSNMNGRSLMPNNSNSFPPRPYHNPYATNAQVTPTTLRPPLPMNNNQQQAPQYFGNKRPFPVQGNSTGAVVGGNTFGDKRTRQ